MRAYRKATVHPVCLYLTDEEASDLAEEIAFLMECAHWQDPHPVLPAVLSQLRRVGRPVVQLPL